jgi:hypothetical protein
LIDIVNIIRTKVNKNEIQIEIITLKDLSTYISERSLIERAYESPNRTKLHLTPERDVKPGHLMRIPHSRNTSRLHEPSNSEINFDKIESNNFSRNNLRTTLQNNKTLSTLKTLD